MGVPVVVLVALVMTAVVTVYIHWPDFSEAPVKRGIPQGRIPVGADICFVFENVAVIPMNSERLPKGQPVIVEEGRAGHLGFAGQAELPADALVVDREGRLLIPGLGDMQMHLQGSDNDLLLYLANGVTTVRDMATAPRECREGRDEFQAGARAGPNLWVWNLLIREIAGVDLFPSRLADQPVSIDRWICHATKEAAGTAASRTERMAFWSSRGLADLLRPAGLDQTEP